MRARWSRRLVRLAAGLVPRRIRDERREEWEAELWHLLVGDFGLGQLITLVLGVWWDAIGELREGWRMEVLFQDVRFALRTLSRSPGFTVAAVLTLALSIGASTALYSLVEEAVFADPPYPDPDRIVVVDMLFGSSPAEMNVSQWSFPRYRALAEEVTAIETLAGYGSRTMTLTELGDPTVLSVEAATPSLFPLLGVSPRLGRVFGAEEQDNGAPSMVALVSEAFWETHLGRAPGVVGQAITLDRLRFEVVGVLDGSYEGVGGDADVWIPLSALREVVESSINDEPWNQHFRVLGRLAAGASLQQARSEVEAFGATVMERFPPPPGAERMRSSADAVVFAKARTNPGALTSMIALFAAVILVLLIATANLACLLLARGASRQHEAAVRASLGAGRVRLIRQLLTESLSLALMGGLLGVVAASLGIDVLGRWLTASLETTGARGLQLLDPEALVIDWGVFGFALLLTSGVGLSFGLLPALQAARTDPGEWLKGGRSAIGGCGGMSGTRSRSVLMAGQIATAVVLLAGASLMMRTTLNLQKVDLGFDRDRLLTAMYSLSPADEEAGVDPAVFHTALVDRIRILPGVAAASVGEVPMAGPTRRQIVLSSEGRPDLTPAHHVWIRIQPVAGGHLEMIGANLIEGRDIASTDDADSEAVVVLGRSAVEELFPEGNPLGKRIRVASPGLDGEGATVVGVVEDVRLGRPGEPVERQAFVSVRQAAELATGVLIRSVGEPEALIPAVRSAVAEVAPELALTSVMSMDRRAASETVRPRVLTLLLGFFGGVALFLVAVGLYGTVAYAVTMRTREFGLRASLGARRGSLVALVLRRGVGTTMIGITLGLVGSVWATRFLEGLVFGTATVDPVGLTGVAVLLLVVALLASWLPARRGTRVSPMIALRRE